MASVPLHILCGMTFYEAEILELLHIHKSPLIVSLKDTIFYTELNSQFQHVPVGMISFISPISSIFSAAKGDLCPFFQMADGH